MHGIRCGLYILESLYANTCWMYRSLFYVFLVLSCLLNERGGSVENSEWMAGVELCFEAVCTVYGKYWRQWNRKTTEDEMSWSICYQGMFGFLFLVLMEVFLLTAPCSNRSKHRGIILRSDPPCGLTFLLNRVHRVSMPRGKLIFFDSNPLMP